MSDRFVRATRADGAVIWVNMDMVWLMMPQKIDDKTVTVLMSTTVRRLADGSEVAVQEFVRQTPQELLSDARRA